MRVRAFSLVFVDAEKRLHASLFAQNTLSGDKISAFELVKFDVADKADLIVNISTTAT